MIGQNGSRRITYVETIEKFKQEMAVYIQTIKSTEVWPRLESAYRAMNAVEELASNPRTSLEQLFAVAPISATSRPSPPATSLALGDQQEPEAATELEKGA